MTKEGPRPLDGITVVSLEHAIAAPFCTRQLADLGARVIKVERPGTGDFARGYDARVRGLASHFVWTNRAKQSVTLDVKHPDGAKALERLVVDKADVAGFRFKAVRPTFDLNPFRVSGQPQDDGKTIKLWAQDHEGWLTMDAVATLR